MNWPAIGTVILGASGFVTGLLALFSAKASKSKTNSETDINIAAVAQSRENLNQSREKFWREELEDAKLSFDNELSSLRQELGWMRLLIENHVPWDWEVVRQLKLAGIDVSNPPTLNYIKNRKPVPEET